MLRLKKAKEEAESKAAADTKTAADQMAAEAETGVAAGSGPISVVSGIGGEEVAQKSGKKKRTPGEIRIQKDIAELDGGTVAKTTFPNASDLTKFHVVVSPDSGFWKGATYRFSFSIPPDYPHKPPKVHCETNIYHPNINLEGNVCLNILREDWKPVLDINAVIYGLIYLFYEPNPDDPLNHEAADLYRSNIARFKDTVLKTLRGGVFQGKTFERLV
jgi:ubiquitin-conjugating enzyme E2 M